MREMRKAEVKLEAEARSRRGVKEAIFIGPVWLNVMSECRHHRGEAAYLGDAVDPPDYRPPSQLTRVVADEAPPRGRRHGDRHAHRDDQDE